MTVSRTICAGFLVVILAGTLLLLLPCSTTDPGWNTPVNALFTATSAVCVTGLVVVDTGSYYSIFGQGIILLLIQVGGLGYMTATTLLLLLLGRRLGLRDRLAVQQALDTGDLEGTRSLLLSIIAMTLVLEITGILCLIPRFTDDYGWPWGVWLSIFHSVSAFNNAGFSLFPDSLVQYGQHPWISGVVTALVILGGIGYEVIMEAFLWLRDRWQRRRERVVFSLHFKIVTTTTAILLGVGTVALFATEFDNGSTLGGYGLWGKLMMSWFQSVIARTAGFNTIDIGAMEDASLFIMIALMFIGASPGSTGGGIKTTTIRVLLAGTRMVLQGKEEVLCYRRQIPAQRVLKAIGVVVGSGGMVILITIVLSIASPDLSFISILFESVSAFATVGLSTGITADLNALGQCAIIFAMYVGRVGILLFIAALFGDPKPSSLQYPEEDILVG